MRRARLFLTADCDPWRVDHGKGTSTSAARPAAVAYGPRTRIRPTS